MLHKIELQAGCPVKLAAGTDAASECNPGPDGHTDDRNGKKYMHEPRRGYQALKASGSLIGVPGSLAENIRANSALCETHGATR
jgi:hypothetical protein